MEGNITSGWKFTWDLAGTPLVLLDFGDSMLAEPVFPQAHSVTVEPFLRADYITGWDTGGVRHNVTISKISEFSSQSALYDYMLSHTAAMAALRHATLTVQVQNGLTYELRDAVIPNITQNTSIALLKKGYLGFTYNITGGELVKIT